MRSRLREGEQMSAASDALVEDYPKPSARHILIVEDEMLIALNLIDAVTSLGFTSAAASRVAKALDLVATQSFDAAILDMNLAGEPCVQSSRRRTHPSRHSVRTHHRLRR
jgi:ActR/RegA family two-component response regulator